MPRKDGRPRSLPMASAAEDRKSKWQRTRENHDELVKKAYKMKTQGYSNLKISAELRIAESTVRIFIREAFRDRI